MPLRRRRRARQTRGKGHTNHAGTLIDSVGPASSVQSMQIFDTASGARTVDGSSDTITFERNTAQECSIGDLIKYVNVMLQVSGKTGDTKEELGWLEWAIVHVKASDTVIPNTNIGTLTLGTIASRMFPGQVLLTGFVPTGVAQAAGAEIKLKIPPKYNYLSQGDQLLLYYYFRTASVTATGSDKVRLVMSYLYKAYK